MPFYSYYSCKKVVRLLLRRDAAIHSEKSVNATATQIDRQGNQKGSRNHNRDLAEAEDGETYYKASFFELLYCADTLKIKAKV